MIAPKIEDIIEDIKSGKIDLFKLIEGYENKIGVYKEFKKQCFEELYDLVEIRVVDRDRIEELIKNYQYL